MFNSLEELTAKYPIGYIYNEETVSQRFYCADETILDKIKMYHGEDNVKMVSPHHAVATHKSYCTIDAHVLVGNEWWPATYEGDRHLKILFAADLEA